MCMRLTGLGSQYLIATKDAGGNRLDGTKSYRVTLPPGIPAARFWSFTLYDTETRSMLQTPQRFPRAGSQSYPSPAATPDADGSTTVTFGPERPPGSPEGNWIQTVPGKGWFVALRLYSPLAPFFDRPGGPAKSNQPDHPPRYNRRSGHARAHATISDQHHTDARASWRSGHGSSTAKHLKERLRCRNGTS